MRHFINGFLVGAVVFGGMVGMAGPLEQMENQRERRDQGWERFNQEQERWRQRQESVRVPVVPLELVGPSRSGPC